MEERRKMDQDWIERDRLLTQIDGNVHQMMEWTKGHTDLDEKRHDENLAKFDKINVVMYGGFGIVAFVGFIFTCVAAYAAIKGAI